MPTPQSYKNHAKSDPLFHFVLVPLLAANFLIAVAMLMSPLYHKHPFLTIWWIVLSVALFLGVANTRRYSLGVQDRLIRLEERLRLTALLPPSEHTVIHKLSTRQLIALRFASDDEIPALARRALAEDLDPKQIKRAIENWRPDHDRI